MAVAHFTSISPALGTMAATESPRWHQWHQRTSASQISMACSPGVRMASQRLLMSTPGLRSRWGQCVLPSMKATSPPASGLRPECAEPAWSYRWIPGRFYLNDAAAGHTAHAQSQTPDCRWKWHPPARGHYHPASSCPCPGCALDLGQRSGSASFLASGSVFLVAGATVLLF